MLLLERDHPTISLRRQCELLGLNRSTASYVPAVEEQTAEARDLLNAIDAVFTACPFYGTRRLKVVLHRDYALLVGRDRIRRAMQELGLQAVYPRPRKCGSTSDKNHQKYPYLLPQVSIDRPNAVWGTDITYLRLRSGWGYLAALIDWYSRYVVGFAVSVRPDVDLCLDALAQAFAATGNVPFIHNSDQGSTYASETYTRELEARGIRISMDGRGRCMDNIFTERLWRSVKYENVFLMDYRDVDHAREGLAEYFSFYNTKRPHQSLDDRTPSDLYHP